MIDLTQILQAILALAAALITGRLIPWIKAKTTNEQRRRIEAALKVAVFAAEQVYGAGHGTQKKEFAIAWLNEQGYDVDGTQIEAAVWEHINSIRDLIAQDDAEIEDGMGDPNADDGK